MTQTLVGNSAQGNMNQVKSFLRANSSPTDFGQSRPTKKWSQMVLTYQSIYGCSAFQAAIRSGNVDLVRFYIDTLDTKLENWVQPEMIFESFHQHESIRCELMNLWFEKGLGTVRLQLKREK